VYELYVGMGYTETPVAEVEKIRAVIQTRPVVDTTEEIAKLAGRIDGKLRSQGNRVASNDIIVGATARHFDERVLTGNPGDFEPIPDVRVQSPSGGAE
jgi:predicted nucleic acid-binding protein